jgi:hypothetical protein
MALANISTDARAAQTLRIDELENVFRQFELSANMQLSELESSSRSECFIDALDGTEPRAVCYN